MSKEIQVDEAQTPLTDRAKSPRPAQEEGLTREQFLRRCETIFYAGLATPFRLRLLNKWVDFVCRFEGGQMQYVADFIEDEAVRCGRFYSSKVLANDQDGYSLVQMAAILTHPCQQCAEDLNAWWTRSAFCEHTRLPERDAETDQVTT